MKITIIAVGKIKRVSYINEIKHYLKQIKVPVNIIEIKDEPLKADIKKEELKILSKINKNSYVISLAIEGKKTDSINFSKKIEELILNQRQEVTFIIGGSHGLSENVLKQSNELISFSDFTFPHNLMRLILVEQLYRAFKIIQNHPYHKWGKYD